MKRLTIKNYRKLEEKYNIKSVIEEDKYIIRYDKGIDTNESNTKYRSVLSYVRSTMLVNITMDKLIINNYKKLEEVYVKTSIKEYGMFYSIIANKRKYKLDRYPNSNGKFEISNTTNTTIEVSIDKLMNMDGLMSIIINYLEND